MTENALEANATRVVWDVDEKLGERPVVEVMTLNLIVAPDQVINHAAEIGAMFAARSAARRSSGRRTAPATS